MVTIRRYRNNRKLYDTARSRYVTLQDVATLVRRGEPLRVIDSESGEDLTAATFAQILFESERVRARLSPAVLADLIRGAGRSTDGRTAAMPRATRARVREILERAVADDPLARRLAALEARIAALESAVRQPARGAGARRPARAR
ncbi:MAG TPA: polyhydroxyalkanoate synthesis regulator DNA-binding domain-containing protein [Thermodesulfobacteriota bacterium]